ncbi:MAG: hypothetical protein PHI98_09325 [Eubacteriales bacterium]|nr:hypothetical protein [Eubacteriales bacterium]
MKRIVALAVTLIMVLAMTSAYAQVDAFNVYCVATGKTVEEFNADPIAAMIQEQTGYMVKYDQAPADANDAMTAITNIFMSRSDYQAIVVNKNQFYSLLAMDALKDLTPFIETTTNMKEVIGAFGFETASVDGKIYGIPQKDAKKATNMGIAFRQDWLEEYNAANPNASIPVPSEENAYTMSLSNFRTMLAYFKEKVPQGGSAFHVDMNGVMQESILPAFGIHQEWSEVDGKLVYFVNHPNFEAYLTFMESLFDEGLMTYQATADNDGVVKMLQAQLLGAGKVFHWNAAAIEKTDAHELDDTIGYIGVLVADEDFGDLSKVRQFANEGYSLYTVVPKYASDEQTAAVIDWADKKLNADFFLSMVMGKEGETYTMEDGKYYPILPAFDEQKGIADKFMNGTREEDYANYWLCRTRKTQAQDKMFSRTNFMADEAGVKSPISVMSPNTVFDTYFSGAASEVRTALITSMFSSDGRMALKDIQAIWSANSGVEIDTAVNEWYTAWSGKDTFNTVK